MNKRDEIIKKIWDDAKGVRVSVKSMLENEGTYTNAIYKAQVLTNLVLDYAYLHKDIDLLEEVAELCMIPFRFLTVCDDYWFRKRIGFIRLSLPSPSRMWVKEQTKADEGVIQQEFPLHSSQFLYLIAHAIHLFVSLPKSNIKSNMDQLIKQYAPVVLDHYHRWIFYSNGSNVVEDSLGIFQVMGWGGADGRFNHQEFLEKKLNRALGDMKTKPQCNAVWDQDMWIVTGASEMLAANKKRPGLYPIDTNLEAKFKDYFSTACQLLENRMQKTHMEDFNGNPVTGYNFDSGAWQKYYDMRYAGYSGFDIPEDNRTKPPTVIADPADFPVPGSLSFDIGHAKRYVHVFETLYKNRHITQQLFPTREILKGLANQMTYTIFNKNFERPLFRNYFDGTNGWYRVNYDGRIGFGYDPWSMSVEWFQGGYAVWGKYQPDLKKVCNALWEMVISEDTAVMNFKAKNYALSFYDNFQKKPNDCFNMNTSDYILNFVAAYDLGAASEQTPLLSISPVHLDFESSEGDSLVVPQDVSVSNAGEGTLAWTVSTDMKWITCGLTQGIGSGVIHVSIDPRDLPVGKHNGNVIISDADAVSPSQTITVSFHKKEADVVMKQPVLAINRTHLDFGAIMGGIKTSVREVAVSNTGEGVLNWSVTTDTPWLKYTPASGTGAGIVSLTVDSRNLAIGAFDGQIVISGTGAENSPQTVTVTLKVYSSGDDITPIGSFDIPREDETLSGSVTLSGWALDKIEVESVKVYRKPPTGRSIQSVYIGDALFVEDARPDVEQAYPGYPGNYRAGWGYILLSNLLPGRGNGRFKLVVKAKNTHGREVELGTKIITFDNEGMPKPFGAIDFPAPGGIASGSNFSIEGWVLTPPPGKIPEDGSTIKVFVDGKYIGHAIYNKSRPDVEQYFPDCINSKGARAYFKFNTTVYSNGVHRLEWTAADNLGNSAGIGSRYFVIKN